MDEFYCINNGAEERSSTRTQRETIIRNIAEETELGHLTKYPGIVKLCKVCISDVCKDLVAMINWETTRYKKYSELLSKVKNTDDKELVEELEINITDAKYMYDKYTTHHKKLQKVKLASKKCIVCECIKTFS